MRGKGLGNKKEKKIVPAGMLRLGTTRAEKKIRLARAFSTFRRRRRPPPRVAPTENNENIDPRENDDALSRRFPSPGKLVPVTPVRPTAIRVRCFGESRARGF